jgi:NAD kinase
MWLSVSTSEGSTACRASVLGSVITLTMQAALIKAVVVARAKVKEANLKVEQRKVKRDKKSKELKQMVVQ